MEKILITIIVICIIILYYLNNNKKIFEHYKNILYDIQDINTTFKEKIDYDYKWINKIPITLEDINNKYNNYYNIKNISDDNMIYNPITAEKLYYSKIKKYV